jgi:hypothetical protein
VREARKVIQKMEAQLETCIPRTRLNLSRPLAFASFFLPGGATPEDHQSTRHPAIEISALPTSYRREHDILQDAATAKARDRNPLGRNGTDIPRLSISSLPRPLENAPSSDTMAHKIGAGVLGTARRHFPMETMETQAMVPDLQEEDGSLTARTSGTSPFDSGNTPSVPGLQIVSLSP